MSSIADMIREKSARIAELRREADMLEAELREAKSLLVRPARATLHVRPSTRRGFPNGARKRPIQPNSSVYWALKVLQLARQPLNVEEIIRRTADAGGPVVKKPTLVSNLSRYIAHRDTFERPAPNTYALAEWDQAAEELFGKRDEDEMDG